jgi:uncharacterized protein YvpB
LYRKILTVIALVIAILFVGYATHSNTFLITISTVADQVHSVTFTQVSDTVPETYNTSLTYDFINFSSKNVINVEPMLQLPDYPTGCELVSLAMDLSYVTCSDVNVDILLDDYVTITEHDFVHGFVGNPKTYSGSGCFPPAIVFFANNYLADNHSPYTARDVSGLSLKDIKDYLDGGFPLLMWTTIAGGKPTFTGNVITTDDKEYEWYISEHCVLVKGYNPSKNVFIINDPLKGEIEFDISDFMEISDAIGNLAVVIK